MMLTKIEKHLPMLIMAISACVLCYILLRFDGTGDDGDSVNHYLFAKYVNQHPEFYFNHWAKPLYVLVAMPFAQFGFFGVKIMNCTFFLSSQFLTYKTAKKLDFDNAWLAPLFLLLIPMNLALTFSGLTEPMFAFVCIFSIYLIISEFTIVGLLLLSFLPFVRSEGLIIISIAILYLLAKRKWALLPLLSVGHIVYGTIGASVHGSVFWVFTENPYRALSSWYGSGKWLHFVNNLHHTIGIGLTILLIIGLLSGLIRMIGIILANKNFKNEELFLIYGSFTAFFIGHSAFWALGIFNSFGLMRVLVGIFPVMVLICLQGLNLAFSLFDYQKNWVKNIGFALVIGLLGLSSYQKTVQQAFELSGHQKNFQKLAKAHENDWKDKSNLFFYYDCVYAAEALNMDIFDKNLRATTAPLLKTTAIKDNAVVIWDDWYSPVEALVTLEQLRAHPQLRETERYSTYDNAMNTTRFIHIFKKNIISYKKGILRKEDFEEGSIFTFLSKKAYAGVYSLVLNSAHQYSPGFEAFTDDLFKENERVKVRISAQLLLDKSTTQYPQMVTQVEHEGKMVDYKSQSLQSAIPKINVWFPYSYEVEIPKSVAQNNRWQLYLWNPNETSLHIDDLKVELIE